jgi:CHRD domain-containing protein
MALVGRAARAAISIGFLLAAPLPAQPGETYKARLSAVAADARTRRELAGIGSATAVLSGSKLTITGTFDGLLSPATSAQVHAASAAGIRGPVISDITISPATSGELKGSLDLTSQQIENLRKGGLYIQIQSQKAPDGVLWGWLLR